MPTKSNFNQEKFENLNYLLITLRDLTQNKPILQYGETFAEHVRPPSTIIATLSNRNQSGLNVPYQNINIFLKASVLKSNKLKILVNWSNKTAKVKIMV